MKKLALTLILCMSALTAQAATDAQTPSPWASGATYGEQAWGKLGFGLKNLLLGWTELITEPFEQKNVLGIGQGLGNAVMDTVGGLLHTATAPVTSVDVPLPESGVNFGATE